MKIEVFTFNEAVIPFGGGYNGIDDNISHIKRCLDKAKQRCEIEDYSLFATVMFNAFELKDCLTIIKLLWEKDDDKVFEIEKYLEKLRIRLANDQKKFPTYNSDADVEEIKVFDEILMRLQKGEFS